MKKSVRKYILPVIIVFSCIITLIPIVSRVFYLLTPESPVKYASRVLKVDVPTDSTVIIDKYEEPSFPLGDGYSWTVFQIPLGKIDKFTNSLESSPDWKHLPLPAELAENERCLQPSFAKGEIPITNAIGYYIFIDHQEKYNESHNRHAYETEKPLCERSSQNFFFSLFNEKDGKLYIWSIDT